MRHAAPTCSLVARVAVCPRLAAHHSRARLPCDTAGRSETDSRRPPPPAAHAARRARRSALGPCALVRAACARVCARIRMRARIHASGGRGGPHRMTRVQAHDAARDMLSWNTVAIHPAISCSKPPSLQLYKIAHKLQLYKIAHEPTSHFSIPIFHRLSAANI